MANESTQWLYGQLTKRGYNVGKDVEEFDSLMRSNAESRQWAYDTATKSGLNVGKDIDEFSSLVGGGSQAVASPAPPAAVAPVEASAPAADDEAAVKEERWNPTMEERIENVRSVQDVVNHYRDVAKVGLEAAGRRGELYTPEGRERRKTQEFMARLSGTRVKPVGLVKPSGADADASGVGDSEGGSAPVVSPVPYGYVIGKDGKRHSQWLLPDGSLTTDFIEADKAEYVAREGRLQHERERERSVEGQLRRAEAELAELRRQFDERGNEVLEESTEFDRTKMNGPLGFLLHGETNVRKQSGDMERSALRVAIRQKEEQIKNLREERDRQAGKDVGFWRGFGRTVSDTRTWDFGTGDLLDAMTMLNADEYSAPDATEGERRAGQAMMQALHDNQQVEEMYGGNASFWNRAGVMTGYMPSFMVDFALTGGGYEAINIAGKAATRGAVKLIGEAAIKEMTKSGVKAYAKKYGIRGVGRMAGNWTVKALGTTADDLLLRAPLMTNTIQGGKTAADVIKRKLGAVVVDENGNYSFENDKTWGSSVWQGEANAVIENYSEMFGAHLDGVVPALAKAFGGKRISGMLARANASGYGRILATTREHFKRLGVSDYFGEVTEEYYGQLWRSMLKLDDAYTNVPVCDEDGNQVVDEQGNPIYERKNLLFTGEFNGDIWGGMALSMGLMGAGKYSISGAAYLSMKHQVNKADKRASEIFTSGRWDSIRELIDTTTNDDMGALAESIVSDDSLTEDELSAVMVYMERSLNLRGLNLGALARSRESAADAEEASDAIPEAYYGDDVQGGAEIDSGLSQSYIEGYETSDPQRMNEAQNMYEYQRRRAEGFFDASFLEAFENNPVYYLQEMQRTGQFTQEEIDAAIDYINAKTVRDGILQRVHDNIDEQITQSDAMINARVNPASGMIHTAVMGLDNREVYVVGGSLAINPDGTIDREASDESIVVRDAQTGELQFTDPKSVVSAGEAIDPEMERAIAVDNIRQQTAQAAVDALNGTLAFNPGDLVEINDGGGNVQVTVLGPVVDENSGMPVEGQVLVQFPNGQQTVFAKEQLQSFADAANIERIGRMEQERAAARGQVGMEAMRPQFALNDEFTVLKDDGTPVRGTITAELDEDGRIEIQTDEPVNGNYVNRFTPAELEAMFDTYNGQAVNMSAPEAVDTAAEAEAPQQPVAAEAEAVRQDESALSRVPVDANGKPDFGAADVDTAWDALVEKTGNESVASAFAANMVSVSEAELKKAEKMKPKATVDIDEFMAAENERLAAVERAKSALEHWKAVAGTKQRREAERLSAEAEEARRRASERAAEEARARAEREEAERLEREALNGVPDWSVDTPQDARARGYRRNGPQKVDCQEIIDDYAAGNSVKVKFADDVIQRGNVVVMEASQLQPSHRDGQRNPAHFLDEAQPKERKDAASRLAAARIAEGIRPEEITSSVTAYTGAPSVNSRGEVIQGNNRSEALGMMYEGYPDSAARYKRYLIEHAAEFGLTPEAVEAFDQPVLVNMLDVSDERAIALGQYVAQDTESGGVERIKPKNAVQKMGDKIGTFANLLLRSSDEEATFAQLVDANGVNVLKWMNRNGYITNTQYASAFDSKGNLTAEAANDLKGIMYQSVFRGGSTRLEEMFNNLPSKAQRAILATAFRDYDSAFADRMIGEIQQSVIAFNALIGYERFRDATNAESARQAVGEWVSQYAFDDVSGEPYLPSETFSNFALALAAMYKGNTQKHIQSVFNTMYDIVQGTEQDNLFEAADKTPRPVAEAIRQVLNLEYQPVKKNNNGTNGSAVLDINSEDVQDGRRGSNGNADGAEQHQEEAEPGYGADNWDDVLPERATAETESSHVDVIIDQARGGDAAAIADLERYGIEAGTPGVYRFAGKGEVDTLMAGKHYRGRMGNGRVDVTASEEVTSAAHKDYRIKFKAEFDLYKKGNGRTQMKSAQEKDGYVLGGYDLRDVESIEELQPDGSYREIYRATESATEAEVNTDPTPGQKEAGNYKKGHVRIDGHNVSIENPKGSVRRGTDADGNEWEITMQNNYGYIRGTEGVDGDHIDVFLSDTPEEGDVFVVDQVNEDGSFDEHKVMYGFPTEQAARDAYLSNYKSGWNGLGAITRVSKEEFKKWIQSSKRKTKPFAEYKSVRDITYNVDQTPTNVNEQGMIVDGEGKPLTLYHGTPNDVELADLAMGHTRQGDDEAARYNGDGISFTPNRDVANDYATTNGGEGKVFEVNVTLKKPYYTLGIANFTPEEAAEFTASLQAKGHDGIINYQSKAMREAGAIPNEVIVFDVNSATPATGVAPANVSSEQPSQGNKADGIASNQSVINSDGKVSDSAADKQAYEAESSDFERGLADFARRYGAGKERVSVLDREFSEWMSGRSVEELADLDVNMLNAVCNAAGLDAGKAWAFRMSIDKATPKEKLSEVFELRGQRKAGEMKGNEEAEGDVRFHTESSGNSRGDSEVYEAAKGLLESAGIEVVEVDNATAQEKLGGHDDVRLMGSRTDRKMSQVGEYYSGKELDGNQQSVVDVFSGKEDNVAVDVERAEGTARVVMRQGTENRAGAKHSLFRHFGTRAAWVTEADIAMIPEIIGKGERSVVGKKISYDYVAEDGSRLRVTTEKHGESEVFTNFLSDRKPLQEKSVKDTQLSARRSDAEVSDAKLGNNSESGKSDDSVRVLRTSGGVVYGWTEGGKVYLNRDAMNPETPLHEYTHLWDDMVRRENPELWARGKELMKQTPLWDEVVNDPAYADIRDDEDAVASEVHSRLTGKHGAEVMQEMINRAKAKGAMETAEAVSLVERLKRWLGDMFRTLRATLGKWSKKELDGLTLEDFNNMTLRDLAEGVNPKSGEKNLVAVHNISEENLIKALDLGGFPMPSVAITKAGTGHTGFGEISLVFGKESVNPADRHNKVYSGDAWTPTFPETGYKLNEAKTARIYDRANNAGRLPFLRAVDFHPDNYERKVSDDRRSLMDAFREDYGAKQLFLSEQGNAVESFETHEVEKYTADETGLFEKMLEQIGVERLRNESVEELFAELSQLIGAHNGTDLSSKKPFVAASIVKNAVRKALDYADNGNLKTEKDLEATRAKIDERINPDEYEAWLEDMFADIVEKKGIRNERDMFTPSGESRRWESLYDAVTLDNVVKAMRRQADKGGTGFFGGSIFGAAHRELKNMEDIRREAAARIRSVSDEEIETAKKRVEERLGSISLPSVEGNFSATMDFVENVREAVVKSHTAEGIYRYLSDIYPDMTMDVAKEISDIVGEIQQMSTRYLEAKPQRAVTPEEVRLAVVPEGTPAEIVKRLESHGIAVRTYERGNEHERNAIISRETSERDLRFHAAMSRGRGDFDAIRERAVSERGIVMPGLNEAEVRVVEVPRHDFAGTGKEALTAAEKWGKENITGMHTAFDSEGNAFEYSISNDAVEKYVSRSATAKSENIGVHLAVLKKLPEIISESIEAEVHPSYNKGYAGLRGVENGYNTDALTHRFYGAARIEGQMYRIKTTIIEENLDHPNTAHSYEVAKIEVLAEPTNTSDDASPSQSERVRTAKLLQGVEKSYDPGKKLLDESEIAYREDNLTNEVTAFTERFNSSPLVIVHGAADIERDGLSPHSVKSLKEFMESGECPAAYCMENKKIYIFADAFEKSGNALITLYHENIHACINSLSAYPNAQLRSLAEALTSQDSVLAGLYEEIAGEYDVSEVDEEFIAYFLPCKFVNPKKFARLYNSLGESERELVDSIVNQIENTNANEYIHNEEVRGVLSGRNGRQSENAEGESGAGGTGVRDIRREGDALDRQAEGFGVSGSEVRDKNRFGGERQEEFAARERERMVKRVEELAARMHLDNVEIVTDASQLEGKRAKAKGFYNKRTGKITVVIPNNVSMIDAEQTLLHEAVAHYGLRQLFGEQFNTFLDNVYESADASIRRKIAEMAAKNGWDFRTATEEYLAGLAEDTDFSEARRHAGWWTNIKRLFLDMLDKIGFKGFRDKTGVVLTDNELRYILWRSYENLAESGRSRGILGEAADVAKQSELKVGNYAEHGIEAEYAAEATDIGEISERFNNELVQYEEGTLPQGHRFELGMPSRYLRSAGFPNLPISMRVSLLATKATMNRHPFIAGDIKGLVDAIQKPIAIFEYTKSNMRNLIVDVTRGDKHFLVGVTLNYKAGDIEINSVSGLFPKDSIEWLKWIQDGKAVRIDQKEKVQQIIDSQRTTNTVESERIGLNLEDVAKIVENFENPTIEEEELFRPGDFTPRDRAIARDAYNRICASGGYQFREALQDSMLGLKELYKAILGKKTRLEDVAEFENAYLFENRMNSATKGQQHVYFIRYMQPLLKEIGRIAGANERKRRELTDYIMAKHGLERNEYMRREAAANGEKTERDFAGLTGWRNEVYCGKSSKGGKPISFRRVFTFSESSSLQSTNSFVEGSFCTF